jgi:tetratricopeptide (TPR) repeat protein
MPHLSTKTVEAYLNDSLDAETLKLTEQHLLHCALCCDAIAGFALSKNKFAAADWEFPTMTVSVKRPHIISQFPKASLKWKIAVAAMFAIPIGIGYLFTKSDSSKIFAAHYNTMSSDGDVMRSGSASILTAANTAMDSAMEMFSDVDYVQSFVKLKNISDTDSKNLKAAFYAGCSAMELKKWEEAAHLLERVHLAEANEYSNHALWYLALTELQLDKKERAIDFLHEIIDEKSPWKPNAERLLLDLK